MVKCIILFITLLIINLCVSNGLFFPAEVESKAQAKAFCRSPTSINDTEQTFEYSQYQRIPFTISSHSETFRTTDPEGFGKHKDLLHKIYEHPLLLPRSQLAKSVASPGDEERMQRFVTKLVTGQPVKVTVLGGSISFGHGTINFDNSWPSRVFAWIRETFPNAKHELVNKAIPATTSTFVAPCAFTLVPEDVDLILMEFTLNDQADEFQRRIRNFQAKNQVVCQDGMDEPPRRALERLLRGMLNLPSTPALLWLHTWSATSNVKFYDGVEDMYTTIMSYYGVPTLSMRNGMYQLLREQPVLKERIWGPGWEQQIHPNCVGTRFLADIVIGYLMDQAATAAWISHAQNNPHMKALQPPSMALSQPSQVKASRNLPDPLFPGNFGNYSSQCILDESIQKYLAVNNGGWVWTNEGTANDPKWGYISKMAGAHMVMKIPLDNVTFNGKDVVVGIGMLVSYSKEMGVVQVGCLMGCVCPLKEYSTHVSYSGWSMIYWRYMQITVVPGSKECLIGIINAPKTFAEGHKLKVASLLVSGELGNMQAFNAWFENGITAGDKAHDRKMIEVLQTEGSEDRKEMFRMRNLAELSSQIFVSPEEV